MSGSAGNTTPYSGYTNPEMAAQGLQNRGQNGYGSEQDYFQDWQQASAGRVGNARMGLESAMRGDTAAQRQLQGGMQAAQRQSTLMAQGQGGAAGRQAMQSGADTRTQGAVQSDLLRAQEVAAAREQMMDAYGQQAQGEFMGDQYDVQKMLAEQARAQEQKEVINQADAAQTQRGLQAYADSASAVGLSDARAKDRAYSEGMRAGRQAAASDDVYARADREYDDARAVRRTARPLGNPLLRAADSEARYVHAGRPSWMMPGRGDVKPENIPPRDFAREPGFARRLVTRGGGHPGPTIRDGRLVYDSPISVPR